MRILLTNDDGALASGLPYMIEWCRKLGDVTVIVPKEEQSGKSHAIEIHRPIEAKKITLPSGYEVMTVDSSTADCIRFAVLGLGMQFDLVISGVNRGLNVGTDIMYSGTVSAAFESGNLGLRALAISTPPESYDPPCDPTRHLDRVWDFIEKRDLFAYNPIYNINISKEAGDILITCQGGPYYSDEYHPIGNDLYRPVGVDIYKDSGDNSLDIDATMHGFISISPLTTNRVDLEVYKKLTNK